MTSANRLAVLSCAALVASMGTGCASVQNAAGGGANGAITMGTTYTTSVLDPAGAYDNGSWLVLNNTFQALLRYPEGATVPQPDAAQSCEFIGADVMTYHCVLRSDLKFSNGHPLTAADVVFSVQRMQKINDPAGPASLLSTVKSVEAKGDSEVIFHLSTPDAVLPAKLASNAGAIVDHQVYPADKLLDNAKLVGSGPYKVDSIDESSDGKHTPARITLSANPQYQGADKLKNSKFVVQYFTKTDELKSALDNGKVDVTDNSLPASAVAQIKDAPPGGKNELKVAEGESGETRYLVFNAKDATGGNVAVRQAVAQLIDRKALARDAYSGTVQPLYSVVPAGVTGHTTAFFDLYGDPDAGKAKRILAAAHVPTPVKLTLTWSRGRAGSTELDLVKKQLEASGLFDVTVQQEADWKAYQAAWKSGSYQAYTVGWTPDYMDPDDYISPLVVDGGAYHSGWDNPQISQKLVPDSIKQTDRTAAGGYNQIQKLVADGVPMVPLIQNKSFYASRKGITGVDATADNTGIFRFWEIGRTGS